LVQNFAFISFLAVIANNFSLFSSFLECLEHEIDFVFSNLQWLAASSLLDGDGLSKFSSLADWL
jgi:hypothetical protein